MGIPSLAFGFLLDSLVYNFSALGIFKGICLLALTSMAILDFVSHFPRALQMGWPLADALDNF